MKNTIANQYFNKLFEATYDNAKVFVAGLTGNPDIIEQVLTKTYREIYKQLLKQKNYDGEEIGNAFYSLLKQYSAECDLSDDQPTAFLPPKNEQDITDILQTEFNISDDDAKENLLIKKAHTYLFQKSAIERKAFVLYFYQDCSLDEIADMFGIEKGYVCGYIYGILEDIKNNFLSAYQG